MSANWSLIDTDILSYILKRREPAYSRSQAYLRDYQKFAISSLTYYECLRGYKAVGATRRLQVFYEFLELIEMIELDQQIFEQAADIYATLRPKGIFPGEFDALIGATALVHGVPVITNNTDHFQPIHDEFGLSIDNWMEEVSHQEATPHESEQGEQEEESGD